MYVSFVEVIAELEIEGREETEGDGFVSGVDCTEGLRSFATVGGIDGISVI